MTPQLLKPAVTDALLELMRPIREAFEASKEWQEVAEKAYPAPVKIKKQKKPKDKGTRHPGQQQQKNGETPEPATPEPASQ